MRTRCPLCRRTITTDAQHWCRCGKAIGTHCYEDHSNWCAGSGADAWIGALER
ncbi:hypothetical protein [Natrinema gelatinilyticum]|uniref:hypothetical protein n=1 Tax=Natrinema gelatinilyticum TaxID=2961571 RepID=UPI0020C35477|nr:hypothetical protein [Natrinema gelatinilyticum]